MHDLLGWRGCNDRLFFVFDEDAFYKDDKINWLTVGASELSLSAQTEDGGIAGEPKLADMQGTVTGYFTLAVIALAIISCLAVMRRRREEEARCDKYE